MVELEDTLMFVKWNWKDNEHYGRMGNSRKLKFKYGEVQKSNNLFSCLLLSIMLVNFMTTDISNITIDVAAYWNGKKIKRDSPENEEDMSKRKRSNE